MDPYPLIHVLGAEPDLAGPWPYLVAAVAACVALLRWGRQDSRDLVEMSSQITKDADAARERAATEAEQLRARVALLEADRARLALMLRENGIDPGPLA